MKNRADASLPVSAPEQIADAAQVDWQTECDLLVVGFGAAGAAAAISAREAGLNVVIIDRFGNGGATAKSGGVVYAGGGTRQQLQAGYDDSPEAMFDYLRQETGDAVSEHTLRRFCNDSRGLIEWLESIGASFDSQEPPPKTSYPPDGTYLYFSGNETVAPFAQHADPAPRGHRTVDQGLSGKKLFSLLRKRVEALDIPVVTLAAARRLIVDDSDRVVGAEIWQMPTNAQATSQFQRLIRWAEAAHNVAPAIADRLRRKAASLELEHARPARFRAQRGVLLTTGGFIFNRQMLAEQAPEYLPNMRIGTAGCDGSGIRLGQSVGGDTGALHKVSAWRFINPPKTWTHGIVVNRQGQRFCNESAYGARLGGAMCELPDGKAWLILDAGLRRAAIRECLQSGLWAFQKYPALMLMLFARRAKTVARLADKLGVATEPLCASVHRYNQATTSGQADALDKSPENMAALAQAPYYAIDISAANPMFPCPAITLGGLRVDEDNGAVQNAAGENIPGLYAAGRAAVGVASNNYVSGLSLADCLWSGRRAGNAVANDDNTFAQTPVEASSRSIIS